MPSRKEIQWSQLKVGALVLAALAILIGLLFLMTGSTGGLFAQKYTLRAYFPNAAGVKDGAPVTLEGVTIGNVEHMRISPSHDPNPVEVIMQVSADSMRFLHTDSKAMITQAGVLGDSYVDIDSTHAWGPEPRNGAELPTSGAPTIQDVISSSEVSIEQINRLMRKVEALTDSLNSNRGTIGALINDRRMAKNIESTADDLKTIVGNIAQGKGTLGKLISDDTLFNKLSSSVDNLNSITGDLAAGKGTAGKLLKDDTLYNNFNSAVANANQMVAQINSGKGSIGKLVEDPEFARKLEDTVTNLDNILKSINEGQGTMGQLVKNRSLYDHFDQTADQAQQLIKGIREDPKKYLVIRMKVF